MKHLMVRLTVIVASPVLAAWVAAVPANGAVNVPEHHNHNSRAGLYIDPAFTTVNAAALKRDTNFDGTISGNVYAQPLYIEGGPGGRAMVIAVTESNNVYALDAATGKVIWQDHVGAPVPLANLPCGDIDPLGITGTPIVDLPSRTLFLDAMTTPDGGATKKHLIYALNVDTGTTNNGWPVDVNTNATRNQCF
jgi:outer membrane protein assembly factor BamB